MEFRRAIFGGVEYSCGDTAIAATLGKANAAPRRAAPLPAYAGCRPPPEPAHGWAYTRSMHVCKQVRDAGQGVVAWRMRF